MTDPTPHAADGRFVTKLTPEVQAKIVQALQGGAPPQVAATFAGVWRTTFLGWMAQGRAALEGANGELRAVVESNAFASLAYAVEIAQSEFQVSRLAAISAIGSGQREGTWQALAWMLERRFPTLYGRKLRHEITGKDGAPIEHAIVLEPGWEERLSLEDLVTLRGIIGRAQGEIIDAEEPLELPPG